MAANETNASWWQSAPGIITAIGSLLVAVTGLIVALNQIGLLHVPSRQPSTISPTATSSGNVLPSPTNGSTSASTVARVPSLIGFKEANAKQILKSLGFTNIHTTRDFSDIGPGTVTEQIPAAETIMRLDERINLKIAVPRESSSVTADGQGRVFTGVWEEIPSFTNSTPRLWFHLKQNGSKLIVQRSKTNAFDGVEADYANISGHEATWTLARPACGRSNQHPGFNYDQPATRTFTLKLDRAILIYEVTQTWPAPCADNQAGTRVIERRKLQRTSD